MCERGEREEFRGPERVSQICSFEGSKGTAMVNEVGDGAMGLGRMYV